MNDLQDWMNKRLNSVLTELKRKTKVPDIYLVYSNRVSEFFEEGNYNKVELINIEEDHIVIGDMMGNNDKLLFKEITHWGYSVDDPTMHLILFIRTTP